MFRKTRHIVLDVTNEDGVVEQERVRLSDAELDLQDRRLVAVSNNMTRLTRVTELVLCINAFEEIPVGALAMVQLKCLDVGLNRLVAIPREIGRLRALQILVLDFNRIAVVPPEIGQLRALERLSLTANPLASLPSELCKLQSLRDLYLKRCRFTWLPVALDRLPTTTEIYLNGNPLPVDVGGKYTYPTDSRAKLPEIFAATTALAMIREPALELLVGLQALFIPALLLVEIIDEAFPNSIPMHKKWELVTAVKHFHERRGIER